MVNPQEWDWQIELMEQADRERKAAEDRKYRRRFWGTYAALMAVFAVSLAGGVWAAFEQPFPNIDQHAPAATDGE